MTGVLPKVFCAVDDIAFAAEVVNTMRNALGVDVFLRTGPEVLLFLHAERVLDAVLEHFAGLLTKSGVLLMVRLEVLFPRAFYERSHGRAAVAL